MKEATGELNMTIVTVIAIVAILGLFTVFLWPTIQNWIANKTNEVTGANVVAPPDPY